MMDALRPDHLGPWSVNNRPTPNFSRLADEGVFFREFFGHMPSSFNARASVLTGRDPHTHGVKINGRPLPSKEITLPQILRDAGWLTALTTPYPKGMNRGFSENTLRKPFENDPHAVIDVLPGISEGIARTDMAQDTAALVTWLRKWAADPERRRKPFFLWADEEFSHGPWRPPAPYDTMYDHESNEPPYTGPDAGSAPMYEPNMPTNQKRRIIDLFDGCVAVIDLLLGYLIDELDRLGLAQDTLLIVQSDHGQLLGELGMWGKPPVLTDPVLRSVLILRQPGILPAGVQTNGLAIMNDVFATVLEHVDIPVPAPATRSSISLSPLWNGTAQVRDQIGLEFNRYKGTAGKGIRTTKWKYIHYSAVGSEIWKRVSPAQMWRELGWDHALLLDLENDPGETRDVKAEYPDVTAEMQSRLISWLIDSEDDVPWPDPGD